MKTGPETACHTPTMHNIASNCWIAGLLSTERGDLSPLGAAASAVRPEPLCLQYVVVLSG